MMLVWPLCDAMQGEQIGCWQFCPNTTGLIEAICLLTGQKDCRSHNRLDELIWCRDCKRHKFPNADARTFPICSQPHLHVASDSNSILSKRGYTQYALKEH
jgi:hypothetical protein